MRYKHVYSKSKKMYANKPPKIDIDIPQNNNFRKMVDLFIVSGRAARHSAPSVESGLTSTKCEPRLIATTMSIKFPPPILSMSEGISGMNVGITTPDELL